MKIYQVVAEANPGRLAGMWDKVLKAIGMGAKEEQWMSRIEPFLEKSAEKYADALEKSRNAGRVTDPNPYAVLKDDLDPNLTPEQLKTILDDITKRAEVKYTERTGRKVPPPKPAPEAPKKKKEPEATKKEPSFDPDAPLPPRKEPAKTTKAPEEEPDFDPENQSRLGKWVKDRVTSTKNNDLTIPRQQIGPIKRPTPPEQLAGSIVNAFKYLGIWELYRKYSEDIDHIDAELARKEITQEMYEAKVRTRREIFAAKVIAVGIGAKFARLIATKAVTPFIDLLTVGMLGKRLILVTSVLGIEIAGVQPTVVYDDKGNIVNVQIAFAKFMEKKGIDDWIYGLMFHNVDPLLVSVVNAALGIAGVDPATGFLKTMEGLYQAHPEWFVKGEDGQPERAADALTGASAPAPAQQAPQQAAPAVQQAAEPADNKPDTSSYDALMQGIQKK